MQPCLSNYTILRAIQLKTIILYCRRNVKILVHSSPHRKFWKCEARVLTCPDWFHLSAHVSCENFRWRQVKSMSGSQALRIWILSFGIDSRADWCKNTVVCDETMIFGMITCHAIPNNVWYRAIRCQLHQNGQGRFYALLLSFLAKEKFLNLTIISDKKESPHWKDASVKRYKAIVTGLLLQMCSLLLFCLNAIFWRLSFNSQKT